MNVFLDILLLQVISVCLIDMLGVTDEMLTPLVRRITGSKVGKLGKPWTCSTCMTFWAGLILLIVKGAFALPCLTLLIVTATFTPVTYLLINFLRDAANKIINELYEYFQL